MTGKLKMKFRENVLPNGGRQRKLGRKKRRKYTYYIWKNI